MLTTRYYQPRSALDSSGGAPVFTTYGVQFQNSPYLTRGGDLTGLSDADSGTVSFWFYIRGLNSTNSYLFTNSTERFYIQKWTDNQIYINAKNSSNVDVLGLGTTISGGFTTSSNTGWHHIVASWQGTGGLSHIYLDDSTSDTTGSMTASSSIDYATASPNWIFGARSNTLSKWHADIAQFAFKPSYIDLSNTTNRRKFISAGLGAVDLGSDGSTAFGSAAMVLFQSDGTPANFGTNVGSGGAFTLATGTLNSSLTNPPSS